MPRSSIGTKKTMTKKPSRARPARGSQHSVARAKASLTGTRPDAVSLLRADHKKMRQLLTELKSAEKPAQRQHLLAQVKHELEVHTTIEEEIFYPAFRAAAQTKKDQQRFHEATAEHHAAKLMLHEVGSADDATEEFPGRAKVLKEVVEHHAGEEETDMFPRARELIGAAELRTLGQQMAERKRVLLRGDTGSSSTLQKMAAFVGSSFSSPSKTAPEFRA
jgi:hemerythrin superfamily protein